MRNTRGGRWMCLNGSLEENGTKGRRRGLEESRRRLCTTYVDKDHTDLTVQDRVDPYVRLIKN